MISKILAPMDGTEISEASLTWAEHAAMRCGAGIRLLTVLEGSDSSGNGRSGKAESYLKGQCDRLRAKGLTAEFQVTHGVPAQHILNEAENADLTVMTAGATRWLVGAVLDNVLREMKRPVVVVRGVSGETPIPTNLDKILVPLDSGYYSLHVLSMAQRIAMALGASVILCHTVAPMGEHRDATGAPPGVARIIEDELDYARRFLASAAEKMESQGVPVEIVVTMGDATSEIIRTAGRAQVGLIAMATRGRDRLEKRIIGSVANVVVESTNLPCLLVRSGQRS